MSLQVVFPRKCFVAANFGTSEWSFSVVASYVRLEAAWPVEALVADVTDVVPLATCLTFRPHLAVVGVVDLVVARVVRLLTQVSIFFRSWDGLAVAVMSLDSPIPIRGLFCGTPSASIVIFRFRAILTCATCGVTGSASRGAEASRTILSPRVRSKVPDANDPCRPRSLSERFGFFWSQPSFDLRTRPRHNHPPTVSSHSAKLTSATRSLQ
jgi:hypothetical protein